MGGRPVDTDRDADLLRHIGGDPEGGWRLFIDRHTPTLLALLQRAGLRDRDEAMEVYTLVCEHLAADDCARLRRWSPSKGSLNAWLAVVVRRVVVDWVRSRAGRRRLFGAVKQLGTTEQRVFELFYWEGRRAPEIGELLTVERGTPVRLADVLDALDTIHETLTERHYSELMSMAWRSATHVSLDADDEEKPVDPVDPAADVESVLARQERAETLETALRALNPEDAAIVRLHYLEGLSIAAVCRALHLSALPRARVSAILAELKGRLPA